MSKANSLENINLQFRSIMGKMGLDEEKQNKLSHKLDLSKKIKTIISMQTLEERKKKIGEYLERISHTQSLMSMLSLHCSIENGNKTLFSIFMNSRGREIILSTVESMEGEYASAVLDFILMLLLKYSWEVPHLLEGILKRYVEVKFKSETFFGIVEYYVKRGEYEILFKKTTPFGCICNCYLSLILKESVIEKEKEGRSVKDNSVQDNSVQDNSPKVNSPKVNSVQDNSLKVNSLKDSTVTHFPSHLNFLTLLKEGPKKEIVNYIESVYKKKRSIKVKECKSERLYEILRIAEEKKMLDVVTCVVESVVEGEYKDSSKDIRDKDIRDIRDSSTVGDKNVKDIKDNVKDKDTVQSPTSTPSLSPTVPSHSLPSTKKKIIKRIVKKTILKPYEQFKWIKIQKKGTIFEGVEGVEVKEEDLTPFLKKDTPPPSLPPSTLKKESVFPEKKSYALNIALSRIKLTDRDLKEKILSLSPEINPNLIKQLLLYFPTEEEREGLSKGDSRDRDKGVRGRKGDHIKDRGFIDRDKDISPSSTPPPTGSRAVSFFKECLPQLDSLKNALSLLNFKSLLSSLNILSQLDTLSLYYRTILSSTPLRRILGTLLSLGNALNKGTPLGQAEAFAFESLPSLLTKTTLSFLRKRVDVSLFREEFKILYEVQRLSHESLSVDYKEVSTAYEKVEDIPPGVEEKYKEIEDKYKETEKYLKKAQEYLKEKIDEEFNKLFLEMYKRVCNEEKGGGVEGRNSVYSIRKR